MATFRLKKIPSNPDMNINNNTSSSSSSSSLKNYGPDFINFLNNSPTPFHAVHSMSEILESKGFKKLDETEPFQGVVEKNGKYYVTRNGSSIISFIVGGKWDPSSKESSFSIVGSHTDSPVLKLKPVSKVSKEGYKQIAIELYGGGIWHTWFDQPLAIAGRVFVQTEDKIEAKLVNLHIPLFKIPTLAIHFDGKQNQAFTFDKQSQMVPFFTKDSKKIKATKSCCDDEDEGMDYEAFQSIKTMVERHHIEILDLIKDELKLDSVNEIDDFELILYPNQPSTLGGLKKEFVFSARLDNLTSCFTSISAISEIADNKEAIANDSTIRVSASFDYEEVGSAQNGGADSNFLPNILERLAFVYGDKQKDLKEPLLKSFEKELFAKSFIVSSDVSHGVNPNFAEWYESNHKPNLGEGVVLKINGNQRYTTNGYGMALIKRVAKENKVPLQLFVVKNAAPCGSTIGPMMAQRIGKTLDLGNAILSMHSINETGHVDDLSHQIRLFKGFWESYNKLQNLVQL
ncbi:hypothetical protein ACO0SA_001985 [Hanseniaspora valbyensis]